MKKLIIILLLLIFVGSIRSFGVENQVQSEIDFSKKAIRDGFYDLAEDKLNALLVAGIPKELGGEVHLLLGRVYYEKSLPGKALTEFNFVLDQFKNTELAAQAAYWIAEVYFKQADHDQALGYYELVSESYASSKYVPYARYSQAWCYERMGEYGTAVDAFRDVAEAYPQSELAIKARYKTNTKYTNHKRNYTIIY